MSGRAGVAPWFFDAHCDTFLRVVENGADFESAGPADADGLHVTLPGMIEAGVRMQVFAAWTLAERLQGREDEAALQMIEAVKAMCRAHSERFVVVRTRADLQAVAADPTKTGALCALESADPLKGDPSALDSFYDAGVRLVTLVWGDNAFCGATFGNGSGLTDKGRELIACCEQLGVMVDVSHASDTGFWDICQAATKPFVASHSDCRTLCDNTRNLTDEMIRALAERGGVAGINLSPGFLSQDHSTRYSEYRDKVMSERGADQLTIDEVGGRMTEFERSLPPAPLSLVADHVKHFIAVGGEDCVGFGGDLDGVDRLPEGIEGVADYVKFIDLLKAAGLSSSQVDKVCHGNLMRVFEGVLPRE